MKPNSETRDRSESRRDQLQSTRSFQDAVERGIARACKTLENIQGAWIKEQEVCIDNGEIEAFRVIMKVTFVLTN